MFGVSILLVHFPCTDLVPVPQYRSQGGLLPYWQLSHSKYFTLPDWGSSSDGQGHDTAAVSKASCAGKLRSSISWSRDLELYPWQSLYSSYNIFQYYTRPSLFDRTVAIWVYMCICCILIYKGELSVYLSVCYTKLGLKLVSRFVC